MSVKSWFSLALAGMLSTACTRPDRPDQDPEIEPLQTGLRTSAALGYCAALTVAAFRGEALPPNVLFQRQTPGEGFTASGILWVDFSKERMPLNRGVLRMAVGALWNENAARGGQAVITVLFLERLDPGGVDVRGMLTVPVIEDRANQRVLGLFAEEDILLSAGSDTLLHVNLNRGQFDMEVARLDSLPPEDVYTAVKQNVWFAAVDRRNTPGLNDDRYTFHGGGQIAHAASASGGILYHALIGAEYSPGGCAMNPVDGVGFIQNVEAGKAHLELGNIFLAFHSACDGKARVPAGSGKYFNSTGANVNLGLD